MIRRAMPMHFKNALYVLAVAATVAHAGSYEDFFAAVARDNPGPITALMRRGFDPNSTDPKGSPALGLALHQKAYRAAAALMEHPSVDVNALNAAGESPLMLAAISGELPWVERLLERGAKITQPGWTALHYAASGPNPSIVELLLSRGAPVNALSPNGTTPLMMAAGYGPEAAIGPLLAKGANATLRNDHGLTASDFARRAGRQALAQQLAAASR